MIKFKITHPITKRHIFGSVLTDDNIRLLKEGKPIHFNAEDLKLPYIKFEEMLIMYYPTNEVAIKDLSEKGYIGKDTVIEDIEVKKH
jgi:hypothetical protein